MDFSALVTGITSCATLAKTLKDVDTNIQVKSISAELYDSIISLQSSILAFQTEMFRLQQNNQSLINDIESMRGWEHEKERYSLQDIGGGQFAYVLKESEAGSEPIHYLCPVCFERGSKSILQRIAQGLLKCFPCDQHYDTGSRPPLGPVRPRPLV